MRRMNRSAFTLIELLIVVAIIAFAMGMVFMTTSHFQQSNAVESSAYQLASVLREVRGRAIDRRCTYGVVFNLQNAPGSSGKILNNRSGGDWYRVIGSRVTRNQAGEYWDIDYPPMSNRQWDTEFGLYSNNGGSLLVTGQSDNPVRWYLETVEKSWVSDRYLLPAGQVRFLAITDQDNGNHVISGNPGYNPGGEKCDTFSPTYPRPWFGWWDQASHRLYPWGGYDPTIQDGGRTATTLTYSWVHTQPQPRSPNGRVPSFTGFYYEGDDGAVSGCVNPSDRWVIDDTNHDGAVSVQSGVADDLTKRYQLWAKNALRPLINAAWQDYMILFRPDGTVVVSWMNLRHQYGDHLAQNTNYNLVREDGGPYGSWNAQAAGVTGPFSVPDLAMGDMCNKVNTDFELNGGLINWQEASSYDQRTGYWWVTLAPDAANDNDVFPNAEAAMQSVTPMYRVGVNKFGEVKVVKVRTSIPSGTVLDTTIVGAGWNNLATTTAHYQLNQLTNADGTALGMPAEDFATASMMQNRQWWTK